MSRVEQKAESHGSLKDIQILINGKEYIINNWLKKYFQNEINIEWVSPLKNDNFSEYRDDDFLKILELDNLKKPLNEFWPKAGPQWDALGKYNNVVFLVEAKANILELRSPGCKASSEKSKYLIKQSLDNVKNI
jgi:hypothetical protein